VKPKQVKPNKWNSRREEDREGTIGRIFFTSSSHLNVPQFLLKRM
jgi:hypothetical protein